MRVGMELVAIGFAAALAANNAHAQTPPITAQQIAALRIEVDRARETQSTLAGLPRSTSANEIIQRNEIESERDAALRNAFRAVHVSIQCASLNGCLLLADRNLAEIVARYEAARQQEAAQLAQTQAREAEETRASAGATFDQLTPHDHFLAAQSALSLERCNQGEDCRDAAAALRHLNAIRGHTRYIETHRQILIALAQSIDTAANEIRQLEQNIATRGPEPRPNERGGTYSQVRAYLRTRIDDPRSYEAVRCLRPEPRNDHWVIECSFRMRNRFGALVLQNWEFGFQGGRIVDAQSNDP